MRHVRLIAVEDELDHEPGWVLKVTKMREGMYADRDGTLLAHDLLEHQNGPANIGPAWDELQALGGVWQVRGRHADFCTGRPNYHSPAANVAADVERVAREEDWFPAPPRTYRCDYDDDFREILEIAHKGNAVGELEQKLRERQAKKAAKATRAGRAERHRMRRRRRRRGHCPARRTIWPCAVRLHRCADAVRRSQP